MKYLGIIPARYESTRLPGKPLAQIAGKSMIRRVYEQVSKEFSDLVVATDDRRIVDEIESFGGNAVMTSTTHTSGTLRCAEALTIFEQKTGDKFDVVFNIQGDEPFIQVEQLVKLKSCFVNSETQIATLIKRIETSDELFNTSKPKVVKRINGRALYFSRQPIPFLRGIPESDWISKHDYFKHIGVYAYRTDTLREIICLKPSLLEKAEALEQNCWLENSYQIQTETTDIESISVDTPEDLKIAENFARSQKN
jgi:3-deoxy-manno-octulosonate cytidylyltransferase (CMP-KDO synthetase)